MLPLPWVAPPCIGWVAGAFGLPGWLLINSPLLGSFLVALFLLHRDDWRLVHAPELRPGGGWQGAATAAWVAMNITAAAMSGSLRIVKSPQGRSFSTVPLLPLAPQVFERFWAHSGIAHGVGDPGVAEEVL